MPRILVVYGTTDGQTRKIAHEVADAIRNAGHDADAFEAGPEVADPEGYDGVLVAASVHARGYQSNVRRWLRRHAAALRDKPSGFVSVCLGVLQRDPAVDRDLAAIRERFFTETGWRPSQVHVAAGALRYTRYGWLKRWALKRIVRKAGGDTDTSRDYEYTDWVALRRFASTFVLGVNDLDRTVPEPKADVA